MSSWYHSPLLNLFFWLFQRHGLRVRQNALLWILAISAEQGRPLGPMIDALAEDESSAVWRGRLRELVKGLSAGMPLPDALERVPGLLPPQTVLAIRVGVETGTLPVMLHDAAKEAAERQEEDYGTWFLTLFYLGALLFALLSVASFLMYYIVPKFKKIFEDFGTELPALTQWIIRVSDEFIEWFPLAVMVGLGALAWLAWRTRYGTSSGLLRWMLFSHARGQASMVLRILSVVVGEGRPLVGAISTMARHHGSSAVRNHLLFVRNEIERGGEVWDHFAEIGMLKSSEARILEAAARAGNLSWALRELARSIDRDVNYRATLLLEIVRPVVLLAVSVVVGVFAVSMFLPLVKLMNDFS